MSYLHLAAVLPHRKQPPVAIGGWVAPRADQKFWRRENYLSAFHQELKHDSSVCIAVQPLQDFELFTVTVFVYFMLYLTTQIM
jgi:hypothetical protein